MLKYLFIFAAAGWSLLALGLLPLPLGMILVGIRNKNKTWLNVIHTFIYTICILFKYLFKCFNINFGYLKYYYSSISDD